MRLDVIENKGPDNLRDTLKAYLRRSVDVCIAVAFVTRSGLDQVFQPLRQVAGRGRVRLLTGLYQKITEPRALRRLLDVQEQTRGRFSVRLSREPMFHRKMYLLSGSKYSTAIVGSSNLTREGLRSGGELNLVARLARGTMEFKKLAQAFADDWEHRAVPLSSNQLLEYQKARPRAPRSESYTKGQLARILGASPTHGTATEDSQEKAFWRDGITSYARKSTQRIISDITDWDTLNYWWFMPGGPHPYKTGDRIVLFDFPDRRVRVVEVKDALKEKTPDGQHFVAYLPLFRESRRFSNKLWASLKAEGIGAKGARDRRKLSLEKAKRLRALLRPAKKRK